jgi:magnesium-transporting ATPase (P-type)
MKIHQLSADEAIASLRTTQQGLLSSEAARRLLGYGPNRVQKITRESLLLRFLKQFTRFFSLILWVAAGLAFFAEWGAPGQGMAKVGYAIIAVILVSGLVSFWQEYRVEQTLAAFRKLLPKQVKVLREDKVVLINAELLVPGDIILLEQGDYIPADCRLIEAFSIRVNNATVTLESLPKARDVAPSEESELILGKNILLAGTSMVSGQAKAVVFARGMVSPLRKENARLSRLIAGLTVLIGLVFFAIGWAIDVPFWEDFIFAIGIIVALVPEGLLPTMTLALVLPPSAWQNEMSLFVTCLRSKRWGLLR